ncbi:MAG: tail fiber domain-containing protein [Chitinophagaceae bacterium]
MTFKIMLLLVIHFCVVAVVFGQKKILQIKADSVRIFSDCDTAELILENRSRSVLNAVLTNKGNGVTEFRKVMLKLNDSMYTIGGDTLNAVSFGKNIYSANGLIADDRIVNGNDKNISFKNNSSYLIANNKRPVIISRAAMDSVLVSKINNTAYTPYTGLAVRGTGCDVTLALVSDSSGTCNEFQAIDFTTLKPRKDSWLSNVDPSRTNIYLLGRIQLETDNKIPDYSCLKFAIKSDTVFYKDGSYVLYTPGGSTGYTPYPVLSVNPSFKHPTQGYNTKMPFVQVNGGLFVGYGRNWYFNSKNANDIINGVDDVPGYLQPFYETRFSVYADSLPLKIYKLPSIKGSAFLTYSPDRTVQGNNVAFEYKDSVYEDIRNYISIHGLTTPSGLNLKENIAPSRFDTYKLLKLAVKEFNYKSDKNKILYTGLIAQEVQLQLPQLVAGKEGSYSIDYIKMVPYLLKAIQDQQAVMQDQQKQIDRLTQQIGVTDSTSSLQDVMIAQQQLQQREIQGLKQQAKNKQEAIK